MPSSGSSTAAERSTLAPVKVAAAATATAVTRHSAVTASIRGFFAIRAMRSFNPLLPLRMVVAVCKRLPGETPAATSPTSVRP